MSTARWNMPRISDYCRCVLQLPIYSSYASLFSCLVGDVFVVVLSCFVGDGDVFGDRNYVRKMAMARPKALRIR